MREKLINKIIEISFRNSGFSQSTMRWKGRTFKGILLSDLQIGVTDYMNQFTDDDLLVLFEIIVRQDTKQY